MTSQTSLAQRTQIRMARSHLSSGFSLANQMSSKRLAIQFPIDTYINVMEELSAIKILQKYMKYSRKGSKEKQTYQGQTKNGKKEGFGSYVYNNYDNYTGYWVQDKMHGMGVYQYWSNNPKEKYVYVGQFSDGKINGIGKLILMKNQTQGYVIYQGYWLKGTKTGYGIYFYSLDTSVYYEGYWEKDMKNGQGRLIFNNGEFSGNWLDDKKHGQGKLRIQRHERTLIYEGQWSHDQLDQGQITYLGPAPQYHREGTYKGKIRKGKKDGQGIFEYKNICMKGQFDNDYFTGKGTLYNDQYTLQGDFLSSRNNLKGKIQYSNGDIFQGVLDISSGLIRRKEGKYQFKNGDMAMGEFDDKGSGNLVGFFEYLWNHGQKKKFNI